MKTIAKCTVRYGAYRVRASLLFSNSRWHVAVRRGYPTPAGKRDWGGAETYDEELSMQGITDEEKARQFFAHRVTFIASGYVFPPRKGPFE